MSYVLSQTRRTRLVTETNGAVSAANALHTVPALPASMVWRAGAVVSDVSFSALPVGTVIAAFDKDGGSKAPELAVYLAHDARGIHALIPGGAGGRWTVATLSFQQPHGFRRALDGNAYRVVE